MTQNSRTAKAVCMTLADSRPAKSLWKKSRLCCSIKLWKRQRKRIGKPLYNIWCFTIDCALAKKILANKIQNSKVRFCWCCARKVSGSLWLSHVTKSPIFAYNKASKLAAPAVHNTNNNKYGRTPDAACQTKAKKVVGRGSVKPLFG